MRGYLKSSGTIAQCTRCFSLRNLVDEPDECPTCRQLFRVHSTQTQALAFGDISDDRAPKTCAVVKIQTNDLRGYLNKTADCLD